VRMLLRFFNFIRSIFTNRSNKKEDPSQIEGSRKNDPFIYD